MEVKIYREKENESLILNEKELLEYNALALELGLLPAESKNNEIPNVYLCMNQAIQRQLQALCPSVVDAECYTRSTIPLEVLKVFKFAKDNKMFEGMQVWYDDIAPDPLLVGWKWNNDEAKEKNYTWMKTFYLIARWGDCACEIDELCLMGFKRIEQQLKDKATVGMDKCKAVLLNPAVYVNKILSNDVSDMRIDLNTGGNNFLF